MGGKDNKIVINMLESIDLRVSTMLHYYKEATYDQNNLRKLLPDNLDSFVLNIYVNDFRRINNVLDQSVIMKLTLLILMYLNI
jgi:hypothetical protein